MYSVSLFFCCAYFKISSNGEFGTPVDKVSYFSRDLQVLFITIIASLISNVAVFLAVSSSNLTFSLNNSSLSLNYFFFMSLLLYARSAARFKTISSGL